MIHMGFRYESLRPVGVKPVQRQVSRSRPSLARTKSSITSSRGAM